MAVASLNFQGRLKEAIAQFAFSHALLRLYRCAESAKTSMPAIHDSIAQVLTDLQCQELFIVNSRRKNGLILYKRHYAEFAGPGAAVGGEFDQDVVAVYPVGNWSLLRPGSAEERERAYRMRRQWIKLFHQMTQKRLPSERVEMLMNHLGMWFDTDTVANVSDEAIARLVGVLPDTVSKLRMTSDG